MRRDASTGFAQGAPKPSAWSCHFDAVRAPSGDAFWYAAEPRVPVGYYRRTTPDDLPSVISRGPQALPEA